MSNLIFFSIESKFMRVAQHFQHFYFIIQFNFNLYFKAKKKKPPKPKNYNNYSNNKNNYNNNNERFKPLFCLKCYTNVCFFFTFCIL